VCRSTGWTGQTEAVVDPECPARGNSGCSPNGGDA
jgi:hypothetical protein